MICSIFLILLPPIVFIVFVSIIYDQLKKLRRRNKELEQLNAAKDMLLTAIGHDLNNTINNLQPAIALYRYGNVRADEKVFLLDSIEEQIFFAESTLQSLLNWGKLQLKGQALNQGYFNAADIIRGKLTFIKTVIQRKDLIVINKLPAESSIYADENQFRFIMRNLLSNAIKFSKAAGIIEINIQTAQQPYFTIISIKDSGTGISREKLKQIFHPFNVSTDGTSNEKGNGIGLMLCKEYAKQNGGDIWAESADKTGTTFYIALKRFNHNKNFTPVNDGILLHSFVSE